MIPETIVADYTTVFVCLSTLPVSDYRLWRAGRIAYKIEINLILRHKLNTIRNFDQRLTSATGDLPGPIKKIMVPISSLGEPLVVIAIGLAGFLVATFRHQEAARRAFFYAAIAFGLSTLLKLSLRRARPHHLDVRTFGVRSYSFPSGHAFGTVIFYGLMAYLGLKYLQQPLGVIVCLFIGSLIVAIGISRIYLKAHYPSDVVGGWLVGLISLLVVIKLAF